MWRRDKTLRGILTMLLLAALSFPACSGETDSVQESLQQEAQEASAPIQPSGFAEEQESDRKPDPRQDLPESVMDAVCAASGIAAAGDGSLLITDTYNKVIWRVQPHNGVSVVYAGCETISDLYGEPVGGYNDSALETSYFLCPWAIAPFLDGWAVSDANNNVIRLISKNKVQTINGTTTEKLTVRNLGVVFDHPTGLAVDGEGSLYVSDTNNGAVRKITKNGKVSTVADKLEGPTGLCWKDGALYIAETDANRIVRIRDNQLETVAGSGENGCLDGEAAEAVFAFPKGLTVGDDGRIYVADTGNSAIRVVRDGQVSTLLARDRSSLEMSPVSPAGLLLSGEDLYICDDFSRKVLRVSVESRAAGNQNKNKTEQEAIDSAEASTVQLAKTEGDVAVSTASGKDASIIKNMRLSSGYHVTSQKKSYAWLELDKAKLVKEDALSDLEIRKKGKVLEVLLQSGNMFFNVTESLKSDETLNICTSTMVAGIRGTCGWTKIIDRTCTRIYLLEGRLECVVTDPVTGQSEETVLNAGEWADFYVYDENQDGVRCDIVYEKFGKEDVPGFVLVELAGDPERCQEIYEDSGIDLRDLTMEEALESKEKDEEEQEEALRELEELIAEMENNVDQDPVWEEETATPEPAPEPEPVPDPAPGVNDEEGSNEKDGGGEDTDTDSYYRVNADMSVPAGTTLTVKKDETLLVESGSVVTVDGTLLVEGDAENNGTIIVNSGESVHVAGKFENKGSIINQNSGLFEATGGIDNYGSITCDGNSTMISDSRKGTVRMRSASAKLILSGGSITNNGNGAAVELESAEQLENVTLTAKTLLRSVSKDVLTADGKSLEAVHYCIAYDGSAYYEFKIDRKRVSFNSNSGADSTVAEVQVIHGDKVGTGMPEPIRTGFSLTGWNTEADGSGTAFTGDTVVTEDMEVYAQWTANVYKVTLNGGTIGEGKNVTEYTYGIGATLPTAADMTKEGHVFLGWYEDATFSGEAVTGISGTDTGDREFYARWDALAGGFTVRGGEKGVDFAYDDASLHIMTGTPLTIWNTAAGTTGDSITVDEGVNADLTLAGVRIDTAEKAALMIKCAEGTPYETAVRLQEGSENILCGGMYGIFCEYGGNLTLKNGVVKAIGAQNGIYSSADLKVTGCELTAEGKNENGIFAESKVDITNSTLTAVGGDDYKGIYSYGSVDVLGSDITASGITVYGGEYFKVDQYGDTKSRLSVTGSGIRATSGAVQIANCTNVNVVSSGVSGNHGIYGVEAVIISDCAEVTATSTAGLSYGIWCQGGITIENCGNVTATGVKSGIESRETVNITNSKVSAAGEDNYGIYGEGSLTISNSEVNAESEGIYAAVAAPEILIQNSTVNAQGSTGIDGCGGSITVTGGIVSAVGGIENNNNPDPFTDTVVFDGVSGLVYGNATLGSSLYAAALTIPAGTSLTVPAGKTLTVLENASMTIESGAFLNISDGGTVIIKNGAEFNGVENVVKEPGGTLTDER